MKAPIAIVQTSSAGYPALRKQVEESFFLAAGKSKKLKFSLRFRCLAAARFRILSRTEAIPNELNSCVYWLGPFWAAPAYSSKSFDPRGTGSNDISHLGHLTLFIFPPSVKLLSMEHRQTFADEIISEAVRMQTFRTGRQSISILMSEVKGLGPSSDPSEAWTYLREILTEAKSIAERFRGAFSRFSSYEFLILFGAPCHAEDHKANAILCALEMQKSLMQWKVEKQTEGLLTLDLGIALTSGQVLIENNSKEPRIMGEAVSLASRILTFTSPGQILSDCGLPKNFPSRITCSKINFTALSGWLSPTEIFEIKMEGL